ncbi:MAG: hypothetical protein KDD56_07470 [Bdellovibrionales bacterium]|nr:hypothetical protein [Bdellovibrionales bacterium]
MGKTLDELNQAMFQENTSTEEMTVEKPALSAHSSNSSELPLTVEIKNEVNDGRNLHVIAEVSAKHRWTISGVAARLSGIQAGQEVVYKQEVLAKLLGVDSDTVLAPGEPVSFSLSIPSEGLSDYQVELLWGEAARTTAGADVNQAAVTSVSLKNLRVEAVPATCPRSPCGVSFEISGDVFNEGHTTVEAFVLGVGFVGREGGVDLSRRIPENEELVDVTGLQLSSGASRPIHLVIDRPVSLEEADRYRPVVRIVDVNPK